MCPALRNYFWLKRNKKVREEITICVADTHFLARKGLRAVLSEHPHYKVIAEVGDEEELLQYLRQTTPDVLIIDYNQPGYFDSNTIKNVKNLTPDLQVLVISSDEDKKNIDLVLEYGINSYLTKTCDEEEILDAIKATQRGDRFFCTKILNYLIEKSFARQVVPVDAVPLTGREIEIVQLISRGLIAKEIANQLNLSTHTVYTHRKNIMKKLQMNSTSELVLYAIQKGLVAPEESGS